MLSEMASFTSIPIHSKATLETIPFKQSYLVLTDIEQIPPHCSLLSHELWYTLNYRECKIDVPIQSLAKLLITKNAPAIFLELTIPLQQEKVRNIFKRYSKIDFQNGISCISPIKEIFNEHQIKIHSNAFLYEMIEILYQHSSIQHTYSFKYYLDDYKLQHYSSLPINVT